MKDAVIFAFINQETRNVLVEQRSPDSHYAPGDIVFPGGIFDENKDGSIDATFFRELCEEVEVLPLEYLPLAIFKYPENDIRLHLYIVTRWDGAIPSQVQDKGNLLLWESIENMAMSFRPETSAMAHTILEWLSGNQNATA